MDVFKALKELDDRSLRTRSGTATMRDAIIALLNRDESDAYTLLDIYVTLEDLVNRVEALEAKKGARMVAPKKGVKSE